MAKARAVLARLFGTLVLAGCVTSTPLFEAAYRGDAAGVSTLLRESADPNEATGGGWTPLMIAAAEGHAEVVGRLLGAGADVNARNDAGRTALMFAAQYGYLEIVRQLLAARADVNLIPSADPQWPALLVAAQNGRAEVVRLLLDNGANAGYRDKDDIIAIELAYKNGHIELGKLLIESWPGPLYRACLPQETERMAALGNEDPKLLAHFNCRVHARDCKTNPNGETCRRFLEAHQLDLPPIDTIAPWR